ncbi:KTSC domain-containing protein [Pantoea allii]|uniref:KTSC domain-containing protein n=1 Tax=Pantoea allii TaxID=574096 RepID=A0ABS6VJ76_9GAMM|nr:KTSC domain-containing protein [Pantoea allii]MBW1215854.1 KTSC domain-containing protein [Pantoea allii]MBW1254575.1 KTSC domain-containing protein [Pantoea allii]MBW1259402.1 KTSC domain-containing protein [Pantoea allii]MBW1263765.1 KTSC domain-containing protein [Pantoea allii]MBW1268552.1 KTSC domain-containing protein [Pantoea allii]
MKPHTVDSSIFSLVRYDATSDLPELEYINGSSRRWLSVPVRVFHSFCRARDPDACFRSCIDGHYTSLRGVLTF